MSAHTREVVLIAAVTLYFVSAFLALWLNRDHDAADPDCGCAFCRRERTS